MTTDQTELSFWTQIKRP